jgi:multicomponent Na+:H+ antiporter subunit A
MEMATLPILILLSGCVAQLLLGRVLSATAKGWLATLVVTGALAASLAMLPATMRGEVLQANLFGVWDAGIPITLRIDGLSMLFMVMGTGAGAAIMLFSTSYMADEPEGTTRFYMIMQVFVAGLLALASAASLLVAYVAWEVIGLCSYTLVGFWYRDKAATDGARKVLVITHLAGYGFLLALIALYLKAGTFDWTDPAMAQAFTTGVAALFLVAAMAKSVMFPLHTWIPEAMNAPTPVSALLHSACYVKAGVYLIARMYGIGEWNAALGNGLAAVGCVTILVGVIFAMAQTDLKRLLAYHTVSQLGYIVAGLALGTELGVAAGLFYCVSHALFKGTLFMVAGAIQHSVGHRDLKRLGGLATAMPNTARIWLVAAASIAGVPLTNGFVAKWLLFGAALDKGLVAVVICGWIGSILTAFSFLKATVNAFYGVMPAELKDRHLHEASPTMLAGMGIMAALCVVFGIAPQLLMAPVIAPAAASLGFGWKIDMTWLGVLTGRGTVEVTVGALVASAAVAVGLFVYGLGKAPAKGAVSVFTGGDPLPVGDRPGAVDFAGMAEHAFAPVYYATPDPFYQAAWRRLHALSTGMQRSAATVLEAHPGVAVALTIVAVALGVLAS